MFKAKFKNGAADLIAIVVAVVVVGALAIGVTGNVSKEVKLSSDKGVSKVTSQTANLGQQAMKAGVPMGAGGNAGGNVGGSGGNYQECLHVNKETVNTSPTYTGDTKCVDCGEIITKGSEIITPTLREGYLSGKWMFNKILTPPTFINDTVETVFDIKFKTPIDYGTGYIECSKISLVESDFTDGLSLLLAYYELGGDTMDIYHNNTGLSPDGWYDDTSRLIIFESEQQVSMDFWNWFTTNATQI